MSGTHNPDLPRHLIAAQVGILVAMDAAVSARQALRDHVCSGANCQLCRIGHDLRRLARPLDFASERLEADSAGLADMADVDAALVRVQEMLADRAGHLLARLLGEGKGPQRTKRN